MDFWAAPFLIKKGNYSAGVVILSANFGFFAHLHGYGCAKNLLAGSQDASRRYFRCDAAHL